MNTSSAALTSPTLSELGYDYVRSDDDEIVWSMSSSLLIGDTQNSGRIPTDPFFSKNANEIKKFDLDVAADIADAFLDDLVLVRGDCGSTIYTPPSSIGKAQHLRGHRPTQSDSALAFAGPAPPYMRSAREDALAEDERKAWADDVEGLKRPSFSTPVSVPARPRSTPEGIPQTLQSPMRGNKFRKGTPTGPDAAGTAAHSYPSPAPTPSPDRPDSAVTVIVQKMPPKRKTQKKERLMRRMERDEKGKAVQKPKNKCKLRKTVRLEASPSPRGLGTRSVVDDLSENGDALVVQGTVEAETEMAYDEAVKFMNGFIQRPNDYTSKASRLTFLQALIMELGLVSTTGPARALPGTLTSAKALLKAHAFVNVRDYLSVRAQGLEALQNVMHPSRGALVRELRGHGERKSKLGWVKEMGLTVLLVSCHI